MTKQFILICLLISFSKISIAQEMLRNDPNRPTDKISKALGVTQQKFIDCFHNVKPAPRGVNPSREKEHANKKILLTCLKKANSEITNDKLDEVMDKYRPEGRLRERKVKPRD